VNEESHSSVIIRRHQVLVLFLMLDAMFVVLHLLSQVVTIDGDTLVPSHEFINVDREISVPTWWAQVQALIAGLCCLALGAFRRPAPRSDSRYWFILGWLLIYVSVDEGTQLHEGFIDPMQDLFGITGGWFKFAWVIPFSALMVVFAVAFFKFWWRLPGPHRTVVAAGGALFVFGAVGVEMAGAAYQSSDGINRTLSIFHAVEEGMEMVGLTIFIVGVLGLIGLWQPSEGLSVRIEEQ
jgi:hypothetical protein